MLTCIDADTIYFRAAMVANKKKDIRDIINTTMSDILGQCFCTEDEIAVAVKGHGNFRKDLYPAYKANRPALPEATREALNYGHEYMKEHWGAVEATGMEADDLVSIWAYEARESEQQYIIAGIDKDLKQIPGNHYNYKRTEHEFVNDDMANWNLMVQCLTGDSSDNIPGIKGIGPVKAKRILEGVPEHRRWRRVLAAWRGHRAGDPKLSYSLLAMLKSWEEFNDIQSQIRGETSECKPDVQPERTGDIQE